MTNCTWQEKIPGCFGSEDGIFAMHPSDGIRAIDLLRVCYENSVLLNDLLDEAEHFLIDRHGNKVTDAVHFNMHITEQRQRIEDRFKSWLE